MLNYFEFEALKPSEFKPFYLHWIKNDPHRYDSLFGKDARGKKIYRLYIPFVSKDELPDESIKIKNKIEEVLQRIGYTVYSYMDGKAISNDGKRIMSITKLLNRYDKQELSDEFNADPVRTGSKHKEIQIVISRHPYDLAGMSSDRDWTSCMRLGDINSKFIFKDIEEGTLIAYLIDKKDANIQKPLARVLIKPYKNIQNNDLLLYPGAMVYGNPLSGFSETVLEWCKKTWPSYISGLYCLPDTLYIDNDTEGFYYQTDKTDYLEILRAAVSKASKNKAIFTNRLFDIDTDTFVLPFYPHEYYFALDEMKLTERGGLLFMTLKADTIELGIKKGKYMYPKQIECANKILIDNLNTSTIPNINVVELKEDAYFDINGCTIENLNIDQLKGNIQFKIQNTTCINLRTISRIQKCELKDCILQHSFFNPAASVFKLTLQDINIVSEDDIIIPCKTHSIIVNNTKFKAADRYTISNVRELVFESVYTYKLDLIDVQADKIYLHNTMSKMPITIILPKQETSFYIDGDCVDMPIKFVSDYYLPTIKVKGTAEQIKKLKQQNPYVNIDLV